MILVDTSVWINYLRGVPAPETDKLDSLLGSVPLAIGDLVLVLLHYNKLDIHMDHYMNELLHFPL